MVKKFIIAIDLGGTNLKVALCDLNCNLLAKDVLNTVKFNKKEKLIIALSDSISKVIRNNNLCKGKVLGVGLGLPGPVDVRKGLVHFLPNIPGWHDVRLKQILEKKVKLPIYLDNDANLMCLAEYKKGAAVGTKNAICITLGTGVGGGIIINGKVYRAKDNATGEIGHLPINEEGPRCNCKGRACLEAYVGNNRIIAQAKEAFGKKISLEELSALARKNNKLAKKIWLDAAGRIGIALTAAVNLLNPDCIVIGGGVAEAGKFLFDKIRKTIDERAMRIQAKRVKIFKAALGNDAGLIGAAILVKMKGGV